MSKQSEYEKAIERGIAYTLLKGNLELALEKFTGIPSFGLVSKIKELITQCDANIKTNDELLARLEQA